MNLVIGIIVTIIGVTSAIYLTSIDTQIKDKNKTITLLLSMDRELKMVEDNIDKLYLPVYYKQPEEFEKLIKATPVTPIITIPIILSNDLVVTNVNYYTFSALIDSQRAINRIYTVLQEENELERIAFEIEMLSDDIKFVRVLIENEISFLKGHIDETELIKRINDNYLNSVSDK